MSEADGRPPEMSPLVAWFSKYGMWAVGGVLVVELLFHVFAVSSSKRRESEEAARRSAASDTLTR